MHLKYIYLYSLMYGERNSPSLAFDVLMLLKSFLKAHSHTARQRASKTPHHAVSYRTSTRVDAHDAS